MSVRIKANKNGDIVIPHEVFAGLNPEADYEVEQEGNTLRLIPVEEDTKSMVARWQEEARRLQSSSAEERLKAFSDWIERPRPSSPVLSDEAISRESIYD